MKSFKLFLTLNLVLFTLVLSAQTHKKTFKETFAVNDDVLIDINTMHSDVEIETWSKDKVVVEATITVEGIDEDASQGYFDRFGFEALGNSKKVTVNARSNPHFFGNSSVIIQGDVDFPELPEIVETPEIYMFSDVNMDKLKVLDSFDVVMPSFDYDFDDLTIVIDSLEFDFDKFKKDTTYIYKWQSSVKKGSKKPTIIYSGSSGRKMTTEELKEFKEQRAEHKKAMKEHKKIMEEHRKELKKHHEQRRAALKESRELRRKALKESMEARKEALELRRETRKLKSTTYSAEADKIKTILENRENVKVTKTIKIYAPKSAEYNMNVRYGKVSIDK